MRISVTEVIVVGEETSLDNTADKSGNRVELLPKIRFLAINVPNKSKKVKICD